MSNLHTRRENMQDDHIYPQKNCVVVLDRPYRKSTHEQPLVRFQVNSKRDIVLSGDAVSSSGTKPINIFAKKRATINTTIGGGGTSKMNNLDIVQLKSITDKKPQINIFSRKSNKHMPSYDKYPNNNRPQRTNLHQNDQSSHRSYPSGENNNQRGSRETRSVGKYESSETSSDSSYKSSGSVSPPAPKTIVRMLPKKITTFDIRMAKIEKLQRNCSIKPIFDINDTATENFVEESVSKNSKWSTLEIDFDAAMKSLGISDLVFIKSGGLGHTLKGTGRDNIPCAIKIVPYSKLKQYGTPDDLNRPENAEIRMIKRLSQLVINGQTSHIVLPLYTFRSSITYFTKLMESGLIDKDKHNATAYTNFLENYQKGKFHNKVSILISEWANKGDLLDFLKRKYKTMSIEYWKVIIFQILSALAVIHVKYPSFRHNDLKANNILVQTTNGKRHNIIYVISSTKFCIPNIGIRIGLWDYDFACISDKVDNIKTNLTWAEEHLGITPSQNRYYDIHYFLNSLIKFIPDIMNSNSEVLVEVQKFINRVVPEEYKTGEYVTEKGRLLIDDELITPYQLLVSDPFFAEFKREN